MELKRQSIEAWQNEKHYSKGNNNSENPIPRQEIFKPVDHVKCEGQVRWQHFLFVQLSPWANSVNQLAIGNIALPIDTKFVQG